MFHILGKFIPTFERPRLILISLSCLFAGILSVSLILEHIFQVAPCVMCQWERHVYWVVFIFAALGGIFFHRFYLIFIRLILLLLFIEAGISLYHVGLEHNIFELPAFCRGHLPDFKNVSALQEYIAQRKHIIRCDIPSMRLLGLSLAEWNFFVSIGLIGAVGYGWSKFKKNT